MLILPAQIILKFFQTFRMGVDHSYHIITQLHVKSIHNNNNTIIYNNLVFFKGRGGDVSCEGWLFTAYMNEVITHQCTERNTK